MKRVLVVLILVMAGVIGLGFYLKWFDLGSENSGGKDHLTLTVDKDKIKEDKAKAQEKVQDLGRPEKTGPKN